MTRDILERLELQRIAGWVEEEHGGLLAGLAAEANVRLDDELDTLREDALGEYFPVGHLENDSAVGDRYPVAVDGIVVRPECASWSKRWIEMADELMPVKVEVDPRGVAASLGTSQQLSIEATAFGDVADLNGNVARCQHDVQPSCRFDKPAVEMQKHTVLLTLTSCAIVR